MSSSTDLIAVRSTPAWVLLICLACMTLEGYDIVAYGAALPAILEYAGWDLTTAQAGLIGSLTPIGMLFGTLSAGVATDVLGRRRLVLISVTVFSLAMLLCAVAPTVAVFGLGRLLVGLGVGGVLPTIGALVFEYSPPGRRNFNAAIAYGGFGVGGAIAALVGRELISSFGFRVEFLVGFAAIFLVLPAAYLRLPESLAFLLDAGRVDQARTQAWRLGIELTTPDEAAASASRPPKAASRLVDVVSRPYRLLTALFSASTFLVLLVVFGLSTWLPELMRSAGYPLGSALTFLLVLNLGTALGGLLSAAFADRVGSKPAIIVTLLGAAIALTVLSLRLPMGLLYTAIVIAGIGGVGTQILLNVFVASRYPTSIRATALGTTLSAGRLGAIVGPTYGAWVLSLAASPAWGFYAFAAPALIGAIIVAVIRSARSAAEKHPTATAPLPGANPG